jgi:hypothetical protein
MLTDWHLTSTEHGARETRARLAGKKAEGSRIVPRRKVRAAVATAAARRKTTARRTTTRNKKD